MKNYKVSVVVLTYNPKEEKLRATLQSILMQKDILLQIIVADDGSASPGMETAQKVFDEYHFQDYVLVANPENRGTVYNIHSALAHCSGEFVKLISPGDLLSKDSALRDWTAALEKSGAMVSCSEAVYYVVEDGIKKPISQKTHPQQIACYQKGDAQKARYNYLVLNDLFLGAAILCRTDLQKKYVDQILGKVVYAEDHIYRLMAYDRVPMHYFAECCVLYETSTGISTSGSDFWAKKLESDWNAADQLLLARCSGKDPIDKYLKKMILLPKNSLKAKLVKNLTIPGVLTNRLRNKYRPRNSAPLFPDNR